MSKIVILTAELTEAEIVATLLFQKLENENIHDRKTHKAYEFLRKLEKAIDQSKGVKQRV